MTDINAVVTKGESWLKQHERMILVTFFLLVTAWLGNHWLNNRAEVADQRVVSAQQALDIQKANNAQLALQEQQSAQQYQALVTSLTQQNSQLAASMQTRTVVLGQQQVVDKTLALPDLGVRWSNLAGLGPGDLTATASGITVTDAGARSTVAQLEQVPVLTANLKDEMTVADNRQQEIDKADDVIGKLNSQVGGLNTQIVDDAKLCDAKVSDAKKNADKAKRNWFLRGLGIGAGVVTYLILR